MVQTIQPFLGITVAVRFLIVDVSVVLVVQILTCRRGCKSFLEVGVHVPEWKEIADGLRPEDLGVGM